MEAIETGLTTSGEGSLEDAYAVPLPTDVPLPVARAVAADIQAPGMEGDGPVGVWAVGDASVYALESIAREFSDWGADIDPDSRAGAAVDEIAQLSAVEQVRDCQEARS